MKNFRNSIDITPWDSKGHSAFGLKRHQARWIALGLILFSIALMTPPGIPDIFDALNIFIASKISLYTGWSPLESLVLTYTIIPWLIFLLGIWIYPYNTEYLFNGYMTKLKKLTKKVSKNPIVLIALLLIGKYIIQFYATLI